ncbi:hypothetical protein GF312_14420 [Candidatus Poribacteria bacterium]|nr:hypothetical protein [Candidatus Poribacteria bacterium]
MNSVKEILHNTIDTLSDDEANRVLEFTQSLQEKGNVLSMLKSLANDPAFKIPKKLAFPVVKPAKGTGIPASQLLIEDRR